MYDSVYHNELSTSMSHQLALIYKALVEKEQEGEQIDPQLSVYVPAVQQQS